MSLTYEFDTRVWPTSLTHEFDPREWPKSFTHKNDPQEPRDPHELADSVQLE